MSDFVTAPLSPARLDPSKRVNYSLGLVLGVDEFTQEQTYFVERDRLQNRSLHGYGTVYGLQIETRFKGSSTDETEVVVQPGMAIDPKGRNICISEAQCGPLNEWLSRNQADISELDPRPDPLPIYAVLCYRECETDKVPIPGGPCRTQEESMKGSRISEDFDLRLSLTPPPQIEEYTIRKFGELLSMIEITDEPADPDSTEIYLDEEQLIELVRGLVDDDFETGEYRIHPSDAPEMLRTAFLIWVTEVRPTKLESGYCGGTLTDSKDDCVLIAKLDVGIEQNNGGYQVKIIEGDDEEPTPDVQIDETNRPYLLSTRLLQEWLMFGGFRREGIETETFATLYTVDSNRLRVWVHFEETLQIPNSAIEVFLNGISVINPSISEDAEDNMFTLSLPDITLTDTDRIIVKFNTNEITSESSGDKLRDLLDESDDIYLHRQDDMLLAYLVIDWPTLDDLSDVDASAPTDGDVLTWIDGDDGGQWEATAHDHDSDPFATLHTEGDNILQAWVHFPAELEIEVDDIVVEIDGAEVEVTGISHNPGSNLYDIELASDFSFQDSMQIMVEFKAGEIALVDDDERTLLDALEELDDLYLFRQDDSIYAYHVVDKPSLDDLSDVEASAPDGGDVLTWNETNNQWEPGLHEHVMDSLKDVLAESASDGDILVFEENAKDFWKPKPHVLDTITDVHAPTPGAGDVLTWNQPGRQWEPKPSQTVGDYVQIPPKGGPYAIVAAGYFKADGSPIKTTFNELEADRLSAGHYRLTSPYFNPAGGPSLSYIIKATLINPLLEKVLGDEVNPEYLNLAIIQVGPVLDTVNYFDVLITQPALDTDRSPFETVDLPFMIEISLYGFEDLKHVPDRRARERGFLGRVPVNTGTVEELEALPRLGPVLARRIIAKREALGRSMTRDELIAIEGISEDLVDEIRPLITYME